MRAHLALLLMTLGISDPLNAATPIETTICELVSNREAFNGRIVKVRAHIVRGFELFSAQDPSASCASIPLRTISHPLAELRGAPPVYLIRDRNYQEFKAATEARMRTRRPASYCICPRYEVEVDLTARFDHYEHTPGSLVIVAVDAMTVRDVAGGYDPAEYRAGRTR